MVTDAMSKHELDEFKVAKATQAQTDETVTEKSRRGRKPKADD